MRTIAARVTTDTAEIVAYREFPFDPMEELPWEHVVGCSLISGEGWFVSDREDIEPGDFVQLEDFCDIASGRACINEISQEYTTSGAIVRYFRFKTSGEFSIKKAES